MKKHLHLNWTFFFSLGIALVAIPIGLVEAVGTAIVVDNTLPTVITTTLPDPVKDPNTGGNIQPITQDNGAIAGNNLFYSFSQFNIGSGDTAYFNLTQNWENVITRVTGGAISFIDGTLRVGGSREVDHFGTPPDVVAGATVLNNAAKNFFFINPSGITFGPSSVVDVPGSFYASTASTINFQDGSSYRADGTQPSGLSATAPVSFGFLGNETGALVLNQAKIQVFNDETLALVGRDITIDNSTVGMVDVTIKQPAMQPFFNEAGFAIIDPKTGLAANDPATGQPYIDPKTNQPFINEQIQRFVQRRPLFIDGIQLLLLANHSQNNIPIDTAGIKALNNQMDGNINIKNTNLINAGGDAEEITFIRGGDITLDNHASIVSSNYGDDCGGFCGGFIGTEKATKISGIDILAKGILTLNNGSNIVTETSFSPVNPTDANDAINIQANSLLMDNSSSISSRSRNLDTVYSKNPEYIPTGILPVYLPINPRAGNININVNTDFVAKGGSSILSSTETFGNAGEIKLTAGSITLDNASIKSESTSNTNGLTGYVNNGNITGDYNSIVDPSSPKDKVDPNIDDPNIATFYLNYPRGPLPIPPLSNPYLQNLPDPNPYLPLQTTQYNAGDAGRVTLTATSGDIKLTNSNISTNINSGTVSSGTAGISLTANSGAITVDNLSTISSATNGDANAGDITLSASRPLQISGNSSITTDSFGVNDGKAGNSGAISITSKALTTNAGVISSSSKNLGSAGQITVNVADSIALTSSSKISTDVQNGTPSSQTGKIALTAQAGAITMDSSTVSSTTSGDANAGDILLSASSPLQLSNNAKITTDSSGTKLGNSGAIAVNAKALTMNTGVISSSSKSLGSAGQITVNTPEGIALNNSAISTDVQNGTPSSSTGKIALTAQAGAITLDSSTVSSTTSGDANAGDIVLSASGPLQLSNNSRITTDSSGAKLGNSGAIAVNTKALTMNTGIISSSSKSLGSAGQITVNTPEGIALSNSAISTDVQNGTPSSQTGKIALTAQAGAITMDSSTVSSTTSGDANAGDIVLSASGPLQLSNNAKITTDSSGAKLGNSGAIAVNAKALTLNTGIISSSSKSLGSAGQITVNTPDSITLANGSLISTDVQNGTPSSQTGKIALTAQAGAITMDSSTVSSTTSGDANAGDIVLSASGPLQLSNNAKITTDSSGAKLGNSGAIAVNAKALTMNTGIISSSSKSLGSAGQITVNTPEGIALSNSAISTDVQNGTPSSQTGKIALTAQAGAITMDSSTVSSTTSGDANAGDIVLSASGPLQLSNNAKITTDSSGAKLGNSGAIAVNAKALTMNTGIISSSSKSLGSAGQITVNTPDSITLANGSLISTDVQNGTPSSQTGKIALTTQAGAITLDNSTVSSTTSGDANAGDIVLSASSALQMRNNSRITTDSLGDGSKRGDSGVIAINPKDLTLNNGSLISSSTNSSGRAGTVTINTGSLNILGIAPIPINQLGHYVDPNFTGIRSTANSGSGGQTGFIDIAASKDVHLINGAQISISNQANVANASSLVPTHINITTPNLTMTNSQIVADSSGNVDAGDINITFSDRLFMDPSAISTSANNGNGGNIVIKGGNMFWLQDSAITTSVLGLQGNGGDISISSNYLIMDSGFIQANTAAKGANGGAVNVNVDTLLPSGSLLFLGGNTPFKFQPYSGINVIQAAAPDGVKGQVNTTTPQLNLSGTLANLILQSFDQNALSRDLCAIGDSSSLSQSGKGGLRRRAKDAFLSNSF